MRTEPGFQRKVLDRASPWPFVGMAGMAAVLFVYVFSGLLAPWWFVCFLLVVWLVHFVLAVRWFTPHPKRLLVLPVSATLLWFGLLNAGSAIFNFSA